MKNFLTSAVVGSQSAVVLVGWLVGQSVSYVDIYVRRGQNFLIADYFVLLYYMGEYHRY